MPAFIPGASPPEVRTAMFFIVFISLFFYFLYRDMVTKLHSDTVTKLHGDNLYDTAIQSPCYSSLITDHSLLIPQEHLYRFVSKPHSYLHCNLPRWAVSIRYLRCLQ